MGNKNSRDKYKYNHLKVDSDDYEYTEHFDSINSVSQRNNTSPQTPQSYEQYNNTIDSPYMKLTNEQLSTVIQQVIDLIIDFTIDNYRISFKIEETINRNKSILMINVHELCIMMYNIHKQLIEYLYNQELIVDYYDYDNIYVNFLENIIFSTVNPYSKITDILRNQNISSFIEQIQGLLDPYVLIFSDDYIYVNILIN